MSDKQSNLTDKEMEDFQSIVTDTLASICAMADKHNIDRDSMLKYFTGMLTVFTEVDGEDKPNCDLALLTRHFKADNISTEFDRPLPQKGEKYKHFKIGKIVTIIGISRHTETEEISVVYEYEGHIWNRPLEMFMSEVDKRKYPNAEQKYRFELVESEEK